MHTSAAPPQPPKGVAAAPACPAAPACRHTHTAAAAAAAPAPATKRAILKEKEVKGSRMSTRTINVNGV
jgi:hypothetical protein